jgi:LCP family protein required for cell wall assembly
VSQTSRPSRRRATVARHGKLTSPHPVAQFFKLVAVGLAVVLVAAVGVVGYTVWDLAQTVTDKAVALEGQEQVPPDIGQIEGGVNLFLAGTDACEEAYAGYFPGRCSGPDAGGELNDVNMLIHISDNPRRVTVISFPRDLMIPIPSCTREDGSTTSAMSKQPLNSAYSVGGLSCVVKTISQLSGLNIPYAAKITWGGVIEITNAIGGVDVCVANRIYDPKNTGLDLGPGMHTLQGIQALEFLRTRHGVGDGSDLARISNQQQYMSRLARKLVSEDVLSNPTTLFKLATTAVDNITPSQSLTNPLTLVQIALAVKSVPFSDIVFIQYPTGADPSDQNKVVPNKQAADALWAALDSNQPLQLTGNAAVNGGVVVVEPTNPPVTPDTSTPTPGSTATTAPTEEAVQLPSAITGSTAAQETCSNGNAKG